MRGLGPLLDPAHRSGIHAQHGVAVICTAAGVLQRGLKQLQPQAIPASELRSQFLTHGFCHVPNYIDERTRIALLSEAAACKDRFQSTESHTIYQEEKTQAFADEHVRNLEVESSKWIIDYDRAGVHPAVAPSSLYCHVATLYCLRSQPLFCAAPALQRTHHRSGTGCSLHHSRQFVWVALFKPCFS